jgi:hypothetical protein
MSRNATFTLSPFEGLITVTAGFTPTANIHEAESSYAAYYILPEIGPSAFLAWTHLVAWLPPTDETPINIDYDELAWSLGTSPGRLTRALQRLASFHFAYTLPAEPHTLYLRRRAATLSTTQLARLAKKCPTLAAAHEELLATAI